MALPLDLSSAACCGTWLVNTAPDLEVVTVMKRQSSVTWGLAALALCPGVPEEPVPVAVACKALILTLAFEVARLSVEKPGGSCVFCVCTLMAL